MLRTIKQSNFTTSTHPRGASSALASGACGWLTATPPPPPSLHHLHLHLKAPYAASLSAASASLAAFSAFSVSAFASFRFALA